ncbi:PIF1 family DEAD/DEAH box helicase [Algibacter aquimarinus]|uniref:DNA helicase Pif1-like DEAD-box helicase domain-containing protein n=1 Tax=Algibacter aquimarinus TaxID=1136748 RepID=A0ABP9HIM1_9FLAO
MGWIIAIVIGYFVIRSFSGSSNSSSTYRPSTPPKYSPPTVLNQDQKEIVIARPKKEKRLAKYDNSIPDNLVITDEFQEAFDLMDKTRESVFITGKAGTGKSTLLKYFRKKTRKNIVILAPTGIAALQVNGQTIHSFFRFPPRFIKLNTISKNEQRSELFQKLDTLIIDEISMVSADIIDGIDKSLKLHRNSNLPFGGVQMVFFGDLFQLPPVVVGKELNEFYNNHFGSPYFFSANTFNNYSFKKIELQKIFRQAGDTTFIDILNQVRKNQIHDDTLETLNERVVPGFLPQRDDYFVTLCTTNKVADGENARRLEGINAKSYFYEADISSNFDTKSIPTSEVLELKEGSQVMLLKNDSGKRYVNGSIGKIKKLTDDKIIVSVNGMSIELEKAEWEQVEYKYDKETKKIEPIVTGTFSQYPLKLAWAITIHKSQGQTFDQVVIDLGNGAFAHGQTYVALSRCTSLNGIILKRNVQWTDIILDHRVVQFMES